MNIAAKWVNKVYKIQLYAMHRSRHCFVYEASEKRRQVLAKKASNIRENFV